MYAQSDKRKASIRMSTPLEVDGMEWNGPVQEVDEMTHTARAAAAGYGEHMRTP